MKMKDFDGTTYDCHGMNLSQFEQLIDKLSISGQVVLIITGNGRGILKERLYELKGVYHFSIVNAASNDASFIVDFS